MSTHMATKEDGKSSETQVRIIGREYLTMRDLAKMFNVTFTTLYNWRDPDQTADPMPYFKIDKDLRSPVRFDYSEVKAWASRNNKKIHCDPRTSGDPD